jgi:hypothetical protein
MVCSDMFGHKLRHGPESRLDGEPQIVGEALTRHGELDRLPIGKMLRHFEQETGNPLLCALDPKHRVLLHTVQFTSGEGP